MLIITRRANQKILFPTLGITLEVLQSKGKTAKIGIDAPPEVKVLREELSQAPVTAPPPSAHSLANALSKVTLAVHLARKQWQAGLPGDADASLETAVEALESLTTPSLTPPSVRRCRALVVEDDANQRALLAGLLRMNGCECATAVDGEDALAYLEAGGRPDVVLLDMAMPRCDGPETLRRIRADQRYTGMRVFSVSSTPPQALSVPDGPLGFDGWFPKPLNPRQLWDAIQEAAPSPSTAV